MSGFPARFLFVSALALCFATQAGAVDVLTFHNDFQRTGANTSETVLKQSNVTAAKFGKLYSRAVDGIMYAQPLYVSSVSISGGTHNVVYVATMKNNIYAFDADDPNAGPYWQINLGPFVPSFDVATNGDPNLYPEIGVLSTPAIDKTANTMYLVSMTKDAPNTYVHRLHALDIRTGNAKSHSPVVITAPLFNSFRQSQRHGLLLANNSVYFGFASFGDLTPYWGFLMRYDKTTLAQQNVLNVSPDNPPDPGGGMGAGIWQAGCGAAVDASGNIYFLTGNASPWNPTLRDAKTGGNNYSECAMKVDSSLAVLDFFMPSDVDNIDAYDADLGGGGHCLLPAQAGTKPNIMVCGGKNGWLYVLDRDNMTKYAADDDARIIQKINIGSMKGAPVYWNGPSGGRIFIQNESSGTLQSYSVAVDGVKGYIQLAFAAQTSFGFQVHHMALSSNGGTAGSGIIWTWSGTGGDLIHQTTPYQATLRAFNAETLVELYNSGQNSSRDTLGGFAKYNTSTVANGRVYVPSSGNPSSTTQLNVYGPITDTAPPTISSVSAVGNNTVVSVVFSEVMDAVSAANKNYYAISPGITISNASLGADQKTVTLTTSALATGTTYTLTVNTVKDLALNTIAANTQKTFIYETGALPSPWIDTDINAPGIAGSATYGGGTFTVKGGGNDIWNTADQFNYMHQPLTGDCTVVARVTSVLNNQEGWAKAGVMIRESLDAGSTYAYTLVTIGYGALMQWRLSTNGNCDYTQNAGSGVPYWVKLTRSGSVFTGFASPDGVTWTQVNTVGVTMNASQVYVGLAVTAHNNSQLNTSTFDNVSVAFGTPNNPPTVFTAANASANPVTGTSVNLSVLGADDGGEAALTYTWAVTGTPPALATFTGNANGTNAAKSITANFTKTGSYTLQATIKDASGQPAVSSVTVSVVQALTSISITPASTTVLVNGTRTFTPIPLDQFGNAYTQTISFAWSVLGGSIGASTGVYTAPAASGGPFTISANSGGKTGTAQVQVVDSGASTYGEEGPRPAVTPYLNMPQTSAGAIPPLLSQTGAFTNVSSLQASAGLIPYTVNSPLWSDGAAKKRWLGVPYSGSGAPNSSTEMIAFAPSGEWTFPNGTVFVKHFELNTDQTNPLKLQRLETRLLVRNNSGSVYGATYKWRADNSDADLLATSLSEDITIKTSSAGVLAGADIGAPASAGSTVAAGTGYNIVAGGTDIGGASDQFHFAYQTRTGDFDYAVRLQSLTGVDPYTKAGLMARESLATGGRNVFFYAYPNNAQRASNNGGYEFQRRDTTDGASTAIYPPQPLADPPTFSVNYPNTWLRLKRAGNVFTAYTGSNGIAWTQYTQYTLALPATVYFGLAATAHTALAATTAQFRDLPGIKVQTWYYPSSGDCLVCHTTAASYVLGVKTRQLNGNLLYTGTGVTDNQLRTLNHLSLFNPAISEANIATYSKLVSVTDSSATLENRARSYIDSNCSGCHRPAGVKAYFDARYDTPLASQNIVYGPLYNTLGITGAKVVTPQNVPLSLLHYRANLLGNNQMPPLARNVIDTAAVNALSAWIGSLNPASPAVTSVTSTKPNGAYRTGAIIDVSVHFNQLVFVTGTPQLTLAAGGAGTVVNYGTGSGSSILTFQYTVADGDNSSALDYAGTSALAFHGGTIKNSSTVDATLALPAPGAAGSLSASKTLVIDTAAPTVTVSAGSADAGDSPITFTITFNEPVTGLTDSEITVTNGSKGAFAGSAASYTLQVNAAAPGPVTCTVIAAAAQDAAGNDNTVSNVASVNYNPVPPPSVAFAVDQSSAMETAGSVNISVVLNSASTKTVSVQYAVSGGTAVGGVNYTLAGDTLTFLPGVTSRDISIQLLNDGVDDVDKTLLLQLSNPVNATLGTGITHTLAITDSAPPAFSSLTASPNPVFAGAEATFLAVVNSAQTVALSWDFSDGAPVAGNNLTHVFSLPGDYPVTVTATDTHGLSATDTLTMTVYDTTPPRFNALSANPNPAFAGATVTFQADVTSALPVTFSWDFSDGAPVPGNNLTHVFAQPGNYPVIATATDTHGLSATDMLTMTVYEPTHPLFNALTASHNPVFAGAAVTFQADVASALPVALSWDFGDGTPVTGNDITRIFSLTGSFPITVTATDAHGLSTTDTLTLSVVAPGVEDTDADGVSDANEIAAKTDPYDAASVPTKPVKVYKLLGTANFSSTGKDACSFLSLLSGLPRGFDPSGDARLDINGAQVHFTVDSKGRGKSKDGSFSLKLPLERTADKKLEFPGGDAVLTVALKKGTFAELWFPGESPGPAQKNLPLAISLRLKGSVFSTITTAAFNLNAKNLAKFKFP